MANVAHTAGLPEFIEEHRHLTMEDKRPEFETILSLVKRFKTIDSRTQMLEVGTGSGWFVVACKQAGLLCKGLEVSPELVDYARQLGGKYGIHANVELGNIEDTDIGKSQYDVIIATSTFEHVKNWTQGLERIYHALKPDGLFYFYSTNKFSLKSGEYDFPLYGWLPDPWRYRLRRARQGDNIMNWGIDFNQFTYFQLRRFFKQLGFSLILDRVDILDPDNLNHPTLQKKLVLRILKRFKPLKHCFLLFSSGTLFICMK